MLRNELPKIITSEVPGPKVQEQINRKYELIPKAYHGELYPIMIARGEGAMLEDLDGNLFLDWIGGVGVLNIGYSRQEVVDAVKQQADDYFHAIFSVVSHTGFLDLAERLNGIVPCLGDRKKTYFANSGAEANENAIKVAKAFTKRNGIVCFTGAFHGRTNLMMELTANKAYAKGMGPFPSGIYRAEYPNLYRVPTGYTREQAIAYYIERFESVFLTGIPATEVAAIIVEPLQGEGGFVPAPIEWVVAVREFCTKNGILMIADEVQSGNCRTGKYFASSYWAEAGAAPDIITTAKSLGSGMPISAITARTEIMDAVIPGTIGGTYNGNPLACASA
ncbi:MAG: aminotransferase class III-fold pyridoxal phosphate-dependent enzyme, partial [Eubacteriales bacterium]